MASESRSDWTEPVQRKENDLVELVKWITRRNLHEEADLGGCGESTQPRVAVLLVPSQPGRNQHGQARRCKLFGLKRKG